MAEEIAPFFTTPRSSVRQVGMQGKLFSRLGPIFSTILVACGPPLASDSVRFELRDESGEPLSQLPAVTRLHLRGLEQVPARDFWWVAGEVSSASERRIVDQDVPDSIAKNRLGLSAWTEGSELVLAPSQPLVPGEKYTLIALGVGKIAELAAAEENSEVWTSWVEGGVLPTAEVPFCRFRSFPVVHAGSGHDQSSTGEQPEGQGGAPIEEGAFMQSDVELGLAPGLLSDLCVRVRVPTDAMNIWVPPARIVTTNNRSVQLDPSPLPVLESSTDVEEGVEQPMNGRVVPDMEESCEEVEGIRICVDGSAFLFSSVVDGAIEVHHDDEIVGVVALRADDRTEVAFGPVVADTSYILHGISFEAERFESSVVWSTRLQTGLPSARLVLNEVMLDPAGAEPEGEWVELYNAGTAATSLGAFQLWDDAGGVALPDVILDPKTFALIVREDFVIGRHVPDAQAIPVVVPSLGKNGLRNSGERIELRTSTGRVISSIAAVGSPEDVSLARVSPWASDVAHSFSTDQIDGASPGLPNRFNSPIESFE